MDSSLFNLRPMRRGRVAFMLAGSLVFHSGLLLVGAVWPQAASRPLPPTDGPTDPTVVTMVPPGPEDTRVIVVSTNAPVLPDEPPQPPDPPSPVDPPTFLEIPEITKPAPVPPKPHRAATSHMAPAPAAAIRGPVVQMGSITGTRDGTQINGAPGSSRPGQAWKTPRPPYPARALISHTQGSTLVRVTTDASGNVVAVVIVKSAGNPILDDTTQSYVREHWKGPPSSTHEAEFVYQIR